MPNPSEQVSDQSTRPRGAAECKPLLAAAGQDLFRKNAFRITGLPVDATPREASRHLDELKLSVELGKEFQKHKSAYPLDPPPGLDEIREAIQKLKDPEQRLIDEFFWFWPEQFGGSKSDPAIKAIAAGDSPKAIQIWEARSKDGSNSIVAKHNLAIVFHIISLEAEYSVGNSQEILPDRIQRRVARWKSSVRKWGRLAGDEDLWGKVADRVRQLNEPVLTTGFVRRLRTSLPAALEMINAGLIKHLANSGSIEIAKEFVAYVREQSPDTRRFDHAAEQVLLTDRNRIKSQIQRAQENTKENPNQGHKAAEALIDNALPLLELFDLFYGESEHFQKEIFDEAASTAVSCIVDYQRKTGDNETFVKVLEQTLSLAGSVEVIKRIEENIKIGRDNLAGKKVDGVFALLKSIKESKDKPAARLSRFQSEVIPVIVEAAGISGYSESHGYLSGAKTEYSELFDSAAIVLRDISLAAWNEYDDKTTAIHANKLAIQHAIGAELKQRLLEDRATLQKNTTHHLDGPGWQRRNTGEKSSNVHPGMVFLGIVGILVVWGIIGSCNSTNNSPHSSTYESHTAPPASSPSWENTTPAPSAPAYSPPPAAVDSGAGNKVYRVPEYVSNQLDREKVAIEADRAVLKQLDDQLDSLGREIDNDRIYLDKTSQYAIDAFNAKVERYNTMSRQDKAATAAFNLRVDNYNARLRANAR